jgi:Tfp pilus assembly protein PilN
MRLNINLASQKYEDVRQFYVRWGTTIGLTAVLTLFLIGLAWINYSSSSKSSERIKELKEKIASLEKARAAAETVTNLPENHEITAQKNFWNRQINRRQLSWTQLFNDLQRIMPARAYLSSVHPEVTKDNRLKLSLVIVGDTHANGLELVQKIEKSDRFRGPTTFTGETTQKDQRTGAQVYKFDIETYYTPATAAPGRVAAREGL